LAFAVGEEYQTDSYALTENDEVVIIPPVSGG
jgi:molybdopterin converting factor small subunit